MPRYKTVQLEDKDHAYLEVIRQRLQSDTGLRVSLPSAIRYGLKLIELKLDEKQGQKEA
jgi:hypothetical protein